jgi:hypothetical protein
MFLVESQFAMVVFAISCIHWCFTHRGAAGLDHKFLLCRVAFSAYAERIGDTIVLFDFLG